MKPHRNDRIDPVNTIELRSEQLTLITATPDLLRADLAADGTLGKALQAETPADWPSGEYEADAIRSFLEQTEAAGDAGTGWYCWYAISEEDGQRKLVGCGGFRGAPNAEGTVEAGYSIAEAEQGKGYATEMLGILVGFAFTNGANKIVARTRQSNPASIAVLNNNDFEQIGVINTEGMLEFALTA